MSKIIGKKYKAKIQYIQSTADQTIHLGLCTTLNFKGISANIEL
jgi:hypothetical protein